MKKKLITGILTIALFCSSITLMAKEEKATSNALAETARSYVLMEVGSGQVLMEKNMDQVLPPASITKVMTLLLIHEAIDAGKINWDDQVTVSEHAASMGGSQIFMEPGENQTVRDLVKAIAIASANDAAVTMAEYVGGSESQFVDMMNKRAQELGMTHTVFKNACGLHTDGHVSTAHDVALMSRELIDNYPDITKTLTTWMDKIIHHTRKGDSEFGLTNTNKMIKWYNGLTGLKTGYTPEAKHCVSATAKRDDMHLIAVVMGAQDGKIRFKEAAQLLDYGFSTYKVQTGPRVGEILAQTPVKKGDQDQVDLTIENSMSFVVPKGNTTSELTYDVTYEPNVYAPIYKGQKLGAITYTLDDKQVGEAPLVAAADVGKAKFGDMLPYMIKRYFSLCK
ncbi:MAG: D-alanyl-D-alanine carboxypeptidase family protein [Cellulosilyticaceae bacterium]